MSTVVLDHPLAYSEPLISRQAQWRLFKALLILGDVLALAVSFIFAYVVRFQTSLPFFEDIQPSPELHQMLIVALIPLSLSVFALFQLYNIQYLLGGTQEYARILNACAIALSITILITFFVPVVRISRGWITTASVFSFLLVFFTRFGLRRVAYQLRRRGWLTWRTLIVGTDKEAWTIAEQLRSTPTAGAHIVGFVANNSPAGSRTENYPGIVGSIEALPSLVKSLSIDELIISTATLPRDDLLMIFETFGHSDQVELRFSSGLYELFTTGVRVKEIGSVPLVSMNKVRLDGIESAIKTLIDRALSIVGFLGLLPLFGIVAALIKLDSPGPVIHRRLVLGQGGRRFHAFKFRTMYVDGDRILEARAGLTEEFNTNFKLKDDPRVTRLGKWLRRLSIDELPQLLNVLGGQMSLVGPRMITPEEGEKYGRLRMNLLTVKPGLTGLWQVSGRSDVSYDERVRLDMYYIRNYSLWLDFQILLQTIPAVLKGHGAY